MADNVGSLNVVIGMDTSRLRADANSAVATMNEVEKSSGRLQQAQMATSNAMSSAISSNAGARSLQQVGFMAQDFISQIQNSKNGVDGLARGFMAISNNVQVMGAGLGPTGMAITSIGGALTGLVVPAMVKWAGQTEEIKANSEQIAKFIKDASSVASSATGNWDGLASDTAGSDGLHFRDQNHVRGRKDTSCCR